MQADKKNVNKTYMLKKIFHVNIEKKGSQTE